MLENTRVSLIGAGAMGGAMISGLLARKLVSRDHLVASDQRESRCQELREAHGIETTTDNVAAVQGARIIVLSIKPQVLPQVSEQLQGCIQSDALVISIIAGARIAAIAEGLDHGGIIRSMPNTPAQIGEGITVWTASPEVTSEQEEQAETVLTALGEHICVADEDYLDMATALSGTGPAYVFLFIEAMIDAGVHLGFSRHVAEKLVLQTFKGSVEYVLQSSNHLARLRNQVTSPGGTSAEALYFLEKAGLRTALSRAIWAAYHRSVELGRGSKRESIDDRGKR